MKQILILFISVFLISACASKRYVKKGMELENSGLYKDAANQYYNSLVKNINNLDAKLALQRTGQLVLDDYVDKFKSSYQNATPKEAVYAYKDAEAYYNKLKSVGVNPMFPEEQKTYYKEVEDQYLNELYSKASKALDLEEFSSSESMLSEILSFNKSYKDAQSKWVTAKYEPMYRKAVELKNTEMYRSAYFAFNEIIKGNGSYKNSLELMNQALDMAKVTIEIPNIRAAYSSYGTTATQLRGLVVNGINGLKSPLYQVVTAGGLPSGNKTMAYEYDRTTQGLAQPSTPENGAKAKITGEIKRIVIQPGKMVRNEKHGYIKSVVEYVDEETGEKKKKNEYDKVVYYEYHQLNKVILTVEYAMKRNDNGEVVFSNVFNEEIEDKVLFAAYEGDSKKLVPGYWKYSSKESKEDYIKDSSTEVGELQELLKSKREIKSTTELQQELVEKLANNITNQVAAYKPEK